MQINILGFGNMGQAIAKALVAKKHKAKIIASDKKKSAMRGVIFDADFRTLPTADVLIIAVKPQDVALLAGEVRGKISQQAVLISIAAGTKIAKLVKLFGHKKVIRVMPNLGILVGQGIMAWKDNGLTLADKKQGRKLLNAISENFEVGNENLIDAVTAVSGSGPAYFFFLADALTSAARNLGLTAAQSRKLVEKTMSAAAKLQQGRDYGELIKMVRSKKGTTDAALRVFAKRSMEKIIREAVTAAYARARKLSR